MEKEANGNKSITLFSLYLLGFFMFRNYKQKIEALG